MIVPRKHRTSLDDFEPDHLNVFVPGVMGAGVLVSIGILISDAVRRVGGGRGPERQAGIVAESLVKEFARSVHAPGGFTQGLRSRMTYSISAIAFIGIGVYGLIGSFWNFINPVDAGWAEDIAWLWAVSTVVALTLIGLGVLTGLLAIRYPAVPWYVYGLLFRTPLGKTLIEDRHDGVDSGHDGEPFVGRFDRRREER